MCPPVEQQRLADKLEPWCEDQARVFEHGLELVGSNVLDVAHFVGAWVEVDIRLDKEDVVN